MKKLYFLIIVFVLATNINATVYNINFGGQNLHHYVPNSMIINLGDSVEFVGAFTTLPLQSTILPLGAIPFSSNTGLRYLYVPNVTGTHNYKCTADSTMIGSFYVQNNVGIKNELNDCFSVVYDNNNATILIENKTNGSFQVALFSENGEQLVDEKNVNEIILNEKIVKNRIYYLQIQKNEYIFTKKIFIY